jgi:hypothetical protein
MKSFISPVSLLGICVAGRRRTTPVSPSCPFRSRLLYMPVPLTEQYSPYQIFQRSLCIVYFVLALQNLIAFRFRSNFVDSRVLRPNHVGHRQTPHIKRGVEGGNAPEAQPCIWAVKLLGGKPHSFASCSFSFFILQMSGH